MKSGICCGRPGKTAAAARTGEVQSNALNHVVLYGDLVAPVRQGKHRNSHEGGFVVGDRAAKLQSNAAIITAQVIGALHLKSEVVQQCGRRQVLAALLGHLVSFAALGPGGCVAAEKIMLKLRPATGLVADGEVTLIFGAGMLGADAVQI